MSKKIKYFILGLLSVTFLSNLNLLYADDADNNDTYINYNNIAITAEEYETLLNLGYTAKEIYYLSQEEYAANKDADAKLVAQNVKYFKTVYRDYGIGQSYEITADEMNSRHDYFDRGYLWTEYRTEVTTISQNGDYYRYHISTLWNDIPDTKSHDIMGIGFNDDIYVASVIWFNFTYTTSDAVDHYSTVFYGKVKNANGGSVVYKVPNEFIGLTANLYYDVANNSSDPISYLTMCGDYAHALTNVTIAQARDYYMSSGGIDLGSGSVNYYDETPCVYSYAYPPSDW